MASSGTGKLSPADFPPPVDSTGEFVKRGLDGEDERIEIGVAIVGGGTAGLACANRLLQLLGDDPETLEKLGEVPVAVIEKAKTCGGHNLSGAVMRPGPLRGAVPRPQPRAVAPGGLRLRRGREGGDLPPPQRQAQAPHPAAAAAEEPRQRGDLRRLPLPLHAGPGRGGRRLPADRDRGDAVDRRGRRRGRRPLRRQRPRQRRRGAGQLRARHRHRRQGHGPGRGLLGPPHRRRRAASSTSTRAASRRSGSSASKRSGRWRSRSTG